MDFCKKLSSWDIYGVRRFPYRGKRKYSPDVHQTFNGSIIIQNDVFGLTILQFEREFKACLKRRKLHEQRIINIRFPDKTTNEYIQYLKYGDDTVEGITTIADQIMTSEFLHLINVAGTELEIRTRQQMFNTQDKILSKAEPRSREISSGSLAEGLDLPGSDIDYMIELLGVTVIDNLKYLHRSMVNTVLLIEDYKRYPGFCKLKLIVENNDTNRLISDSLIETKCGIFISAEKFINTFSPFISDLKTIHGPCLSDADQIIDLAICFRSKCWPQIAKDWIKRHKQGQWPTENVINSVVKDGCLFVPIGPKNECDELLWRISFSLAEKRLIHTFNYTQLLCYSLLKLTLKNIINRNKEVKDLLCSYFLKTTVFWLSEEISIDTFKFKNLSHCFSLCVDKLMLFVRNCYCPNFFIPQHNMFIGRLDESNNQLLLSMLCELGHNGLKFIIGRICGTDVRNHTLFAMTDTNFCSINLDFLFFRVGSVFTCTNAESGYKTLQYINLLMKSESSEFILDALRYNHAEVNQQISQMLVLPEHIRERNDMIRRCKKHLMDGTKTDAVSGWLLYASFYYVLGQYKNTIQIVDHVLCRCSPDMILLGQYVYTTEDMKKYSHKTKGYLTLNHRMTHGTISNVRYIKQSALIPQELQLEVQDGPFCVNPAVLAHFLRYFSYTYLHDNNNIERALRELYLTVTEGYFMDNVTSSSSLVLLGICYEISGDRDTAYHWYNKALHCGGYVCRSAEQRIANLISS